MQLHIYTLPWVVLLTPPPKPLPHAALLNICGGFYAFKARGPHEQDRPIALTLTHTLTIAHSP